MNRSHCRQVLDCASPLALFDLVWGRKSGRGLPQSKTLLRQTSPDRGAVNAYIRKSVLFAPIFRPRVFPYLHEEQVGRGQGLLKKMQLLSPPARTTPLRRGEGPASPPWHGWEGVSLVAALPR